MSFHSKKLLQSNASFAAATYDSLVLCPSQERRRDCDEIWSETEGPRQLLNVLASFHFVSRLEKPFSPHVKWSCTCPRFWKWCICPHSVLMTLFTDKNFVLPGILDERRLEKHDNARAAAKAFAIAQRDEEKEQDKRVLCEDGRQPKSVQQSRSAP